MKRFPNFFMYFFEEQKVPEIYSRIKYLDYQIPLDDAYGRSTDSNSPGVYSISLIPEYINPQIITPLSFEVRSFHQNNLGYSIFLDGITDLNSYLKEQFKGNYRNLIKRRKRLESCFNIRYATYHGAIALQDYKELMQSLHDMLARRFRQRNDKNRILDKWDVLLSKTFDQINSKKASLSVIYAGDRPIDISLNYHCHKILFGSVSSYDIDYRKFGLGNLEKIKILEWCLAHDYAILELGFGDLAYKMAWSNHTYNFKSQVIYDANSIKSKVRGTLEILKLKIKEFLKKRKVNVYYKRLRQFKITRKSVQASAESKFTCRSIHLTDIENQGELKTIDYLRTEFAFPLKLYVNNFIYSTLEHCDDIVVKQVLHKKDTFIILGSKQIHKIIVTQ